MKAWWPLLALLFKAPSGHEGKVMDIPIETEKYTDKPQWFNAKPTKQNSLFGVGVANKKTTQQSRIAAMNEGIKDLILEISKNEHFKNIYCENFTCQSKSQLEKELVNKIIFKETYLAADSNLYVLIELPLDDETNT